MRRDRLYYWLGNGLGGRKKIQSWVTNVGDRLAPAEVDGQDAHIVREDLEELRNMPSAAVRLLPAYEQWVLGPGTADAHVVPLAGTGLQGAGRCEPEH